MTLTFHSIGRFEQRYKQIQKHTITSNTILSLKMLKNQFNRTFSFGLFRHYFNTLIVFSESAFINFFRSITYHEALIVWRVLVYI